MIDAGNPCETCQPVTVDRDNIKISLSLNQPSGDFARDPLGKETLFVITHMKR